MANDIIRYLLASFLVGGNDLLQLINQNLFHLAGEHLAGAVVLANLLQQIVVLQDVLQVRVRNVNVEVGSLL